MIICNINLDVYEDGILCGNVTIKKMDAIRDIKEVQLKKDGS